MFAELERGPGFIMGGQLTSLEGILDRESFDRKYPRRLKDVPRVVEGF